MSASRVPIILLAGVLLLGGCASPSDGGTPTPTAPPTSPTAEPEQQRETGLTRPALVFDGQCDSLFTDAELSSVLGQTPPLVANHFTELWGGQGMIDQAGGLECTWRGDGAAVIALVLPEEATPGYVASWTTCSDGGHDFDEMTCPIDAVTNGSRISGLVAVGSDEATATTAAQAFTDIFSTKAAAAEPVPVPIPAVGAWSLPVDCVTVVSGADLSAVPGLGASATGDNGGGYGKTTPELERTLFGNWMPPTCFIIGESATVEFVPIGGSRWREAETAARSDATPLQLTGVESAYAVPYRDGQSLVYAFTGPNMLVFTVRYTGNADGIASALVAWLDTTGAP